MSLLERSFWVFDMDGTLTVPQHDFDNFKRSVGLPLDQDILGALERASPARRQQVLAAVVAWEDGIARAARAQDDAVALLDALVARGARLAVLTRNSKAGAHITLQAAGLDRYFADEAWVLGRDCAPHKPAPDGVLLALSRMGGDSSDAVMVGDWVFDVQAGRNAGTATVLVDRHGDVPADWAPWCDRIVKQLDELL